MGRGSRELTARTLTSSVDASSNRTLAQMYRLSEVSAAISALAPGAGCPRRRLLAQQALDLRQLFRRQGFACQQVLHQQRRSTIEDVANDPLQAQRLVALLRDRRGVQMSTAFLLARDVALLLQDAHDGGDARVREVALRPQLFLHSSHRTGPDPPD